MSYPSTIDSFTNPTPSDDLSTASVLHTSQHTNANNAISAIETKVGVNNSAVASSLDYRVTQLETGNNGYNVVSYGAVGNGTTDDTTAIQNAINAAHSAKKGTVYFPPGIYKISSTLTIYTGVSLVGAGSAASIINQVTTSANGITAVDAGALTIQNLRINGPASGSGVGISMSHSSANNVPYLTFIGLKVVNFGSHGIFIHTAIVSSFIDVVCETNGGYGFNFDSSSTSLSFVSCYGNGNSTGGYRVSQSVYINFSACAADSNPIGYLIDGTQGVALTACGAESSPVGVKVNNCTNITLQTCWNYDNQGTAYWVTSNSQGVELYACTENTPSLSATACFKVDPGSRSLITAPKSVTANSLSTLVTVIDDTAAESTFNGTTFMANTSIFGTLSIGSGAVFNITDNAGANKVLISDSLGNASWSTVSNIGSGSPFPITGSSGTMILNANNDGGNYNISVDTTGVLALFGSGGQTLNVSLLDGYLQLTALTASTLPYLDSNKRLASSSATLDGSGNLVTTSSTTTKLIKQTSSPPANAGSTGTAGQIEWASGFLYVCVATNTWQRVVIATW